MKIFLSKARSISSKQKLLILMRESSFQFVAPPQTEDSPLYREVALKACILKEIATNLKELVNKNNKSS